MTSNAKTNPVSGNNQTDSPSLEKDSMFHVQTGLRAGSFSDFYSGFFAGARDATASANAADASTGAGRWI